MGAMRNRDRPSLSLFADELRAARVRAGRSREQLAERLGYSPSLVTLIETGHRVPQPAFARRCDEVLETTGIFVRLEEQLRGLSFPAAFRPSASYEPDARTLRTAQHSLVPGIVQTGDCARAVLGIRPGITDDERADLVAADRDVADDLVERGYV